MRHRRAGVVLLAALVGLVLVALLFVDDSSSASSASCRSPACRAMVARIDADIGRTFGRRLAPTFRCIAHRESHYRFDPWAALTARSSTSDYGLLQVHVSPGDRGRTTSPGRWWSIRELRTLAGNLAAARDLYRHGGLDHWRATRYGCQMLGDLVELRDGRRGRVVDYHYEPGAGRVHGVTFLLVELEPDGRRTFAHPAGVTVLERAGIAEAST